MPNIIINEDASEIAKSAKLRYVTASMSGYSRVKKGKNFQYFDAKGQKVTDPDVLKRINGLVLPPAWTEVWICPYANGHLQATGFDVRGRKQYRYHTSWSQTRNKNKYERLLMFGKKLPQIRKKIRNDIKKKNFIKDNVIAVALKVMEETLIRVGNKAYERENESYGLTTLKNKHLKIGEGSAFFKFKGKKGIVHQIELKKAALVRLLKKVKELPGQEVFQYYDETGILKRLDSGDINAYLKECTGEDFTCKDFRTWAGSAYALEVLAYSEEYSNKTECNKNILSTADSVAKRLGNTRTVCRKYYIHPAIFSEYEAGNIFPLLKKIQKGDGAASKGELRHTEKILLSFLKKLSNQLT